MDNKTNPKFSPITLVVKKNIKHLRLVAGHSMNKGAGLLGLTRKQLEDIETGRNYGCHIDLELLAKIKAAYGESVDKLIGNLPDDASSEYFSRPRKRIGSRGR